MEILNNINENNQKVEQYNGGEKKKKTFKEKLFSFIKWFFIILFLIYVAILVARGIWLERQEVTEEKIVQIHAQKINIDDVMGKNLPQDTG